MFGIPGFIASLGAKFWFYLAALAIVTAAIGGAYVKGKSEGSTEGYRTGYTEGQASKQNTINDLTNKINTDAKLANEKITKLERMSADAVDSINKLTLELSKKRTQIVYEYLERYPEIANRTAFSLPTVETLNLLLSVDIVLDSSGKPVTKLLDATPNLEPSQGENK